MNAFIFVTIESVVLFIFSIRVCMYVHFFNKKKQKKKTVNYLDRDLHTRYVVSPVIMLILKKVQYIAF